MKKHIALYFIFCSLLFSQVCQAQQQLNTSQIDELSKIIHQDMDESSAPGAVFAIVRNEKIIYEEAFGVTNLETKMPTTTQTIFPVGSVTKFFTALALLTTMEEKNLDENTTVGSVVSDLPEKLSALTIHNLLSNSAGILDWWPNTNECKGSLFEHFLKVGDRALFADQSSVFSYSNNGFTLAGLVLSRLKNMSYTEAIDSIMSIPLQMNHTTFKLEEVVAHSFATGHSKDNKTGDKVPTATGLTDPIVQPAGGLFSNIPDLARLAICFMNDGVLDEKKIVNTEVIRKMSIGYTQMGVLKPYMGYPDSKYGYGSIVFTRNGISYVANAGETGNANTLFVMAPKQKTAFIVLSNTGYHPFTPSIEKAMDLMFPVSEEETQQLPPEKLEELVGKYYLPNIRGTKENVVEIFAKENVLLMRIAQDKVFSLTRSGIITYQYIDPEFTIPLEIAFYHDKSENVKYLNLFWRTRIKL